MDTDLMREARELIDFYDSRGSNWESALAFVLCREMFGVGVRVHPADGYRCYLYPKEKAN